MQPGIPIPFIQKAIKILHAAERFAGDCSEGQASPEFEQFLKLEAEIRVVRMGLENATHKYAEVEKPVLCCKKRDTKDFKCACRKCKKARGEKKPRMRRARLRNDRFTALHDSFQAHWMLVIWGSYTETRFDYAPTQGEPLPPRHTKRRRFLSFVRREATTAYRITNAKKCWVLMKEYGPVNHCAFWAQVPGIVGTTEYEAIPHHAVGDGSAMPQPYNVALGYKGDVAARVPWRLYQEAPL